MQTLKSLTFTTIPAAERTPLFHRRQRLVANLEDQIALAGDPRYVRVVNKWKKQGGERVSTEKTVRVRPWWATDQKGKIVLAVKVGSKPIEFDKGKTAILVGEKENLVPVLRTVVAAVQAGELDSVLEQTKVARPSIKKKAA